VEADSQDMREAACTLHLSKSTFQQEQELVKLRIFRGALVSCRTWILMGPPAKGISSVIASPLKLAAAAPDKKIGSKRQLRSSSAGVNGKGSRIAEKVLAAVTVRINGYLDRANAGWAQILNMSTQRERAGYGTQLIGGVQELLRREGVDVIVLYPALNGRAPSFWSSLGYGIREPSLLPSAELVSHDQGGPLLPEFDSGTHQALPRWEKSIIIQGSLKGGRKFSRIATGTSRIYGEALETVVASMRAERSVNKELGLVCC